jgi:hypothetical protein
VGGWVESEENVPQGTKEKSLPTLESLSLAETDLSVSNTGFTFMKPNTTRQR